MGGAAKYFELHTARARRAEISHPRARAAARERGYRPLLRIPARTFPIRPHGPVQECGGPAGNSARLER